MSNYSCDTDPSQYVNTPKASIWFSDLGAVQGAERFVSTAADLPKSGPKAPLVCG